VRIAPEGDAHFPPIDHAKWRQTARQSHPADEFNEHAFDFVTLNRND
jgi:dihydrofolate reductase